MLWNILYKNDGTYCVSCKRKIAIEYLGVRRTKQNRSMLVSKYAVCSTKNLRFINNQETRRLELY